MLDYYYNNVPNVGLCRNNLVYTSLISSDGKTFCQWYYNDSIYHRGENKLSNDTIEYKWQKEIKFLMQMESKHPNLIPTISEIDFKNKKVYFDIDSVDFWQQSNCNQENYNNILPDWQDQMLEHLSAYRAEGFWKYSLHPNSYFIVNGRLKSINYFFCYDDNEDKIAINDVIDHISDNRQDELLNYLNKNNLDPADKLTFNLYGQIALESFRSNYPSEFINKAKQIYK